MQPNCKHLIGLRVIKTARDVESINNAARNGFFPLIREVSPSAEIRSKYAIYQNEITGEILVSGDFRSIEDGFFVEDYKKVVDFTWYYPHHFPSPFAAYLVPKDINVGEKVYLEDLIEDYIGSSWNQGDTYRLESCVAVWNGEDFDIQYEPSQQNMVLG